MSRQCRPASSGQRTNPAKRGSQAAPERHGQPDLHNPYDAVLASLVGLPVPPATQARSRNAPSRSRSYRPPKPTTRQAQEDTICAARGLPELDPAAAPNGGYTRCCRRSADQALRRRRAGMRRALSHSERTGSVGANGTTLRQKTLPDLAQRLFRGQKLRQNLPTRAERDHQGHASCLVSGGGGGI
jgi:hypothetical protein